jgi:hypothetical protein
MFPIIGFLASQVLRIVGSQIHKTEKKKKSLISILTNIVYNQKILKI